MNELIRQLAAPHMMHERFSRYGESTEEDYYEFYPDELEEFVETIVRECIECVDGYTKPRTGNTEYDAVEQIKQHFGVK